MADTHTGSRRTYLWLSPGLWCALVALMASQSYAQVGPVSQLDRALAKLGVPDNVWAFLPESCVHALAATQAGADGDWRAAVTEVGCRVWEEDDVVAIIGPELEREGNTVHDAARPGPADLAAILTGTPLVQQPALRAFGWVPVSELSPVAQAVVEQYSALGSPVRGVAEPATYVTLRLRIQSRLRRVAAPEVRYPPCPSSSSRCASCRSMRGRSATPLGSPVFTCPSTYIVSAPVLAAGYGCEPHRQASGVRHGLTYARSVNDQRRELCWRPPQVGMATSGNWIGDLG